MPRARERWNLAARAGRWSSERRRAAVIGWLAFVIAVAAIGFALGTRSMSTSDYATGESGVATRILARDFPQPAAESVLVHSPAATMRDPGFRPTVAGVVDRLGTLRDVIGVRSPLGSGGRDLVSPDGHSALVQFQIAGSADAAAGRIVPVPSPLTSSAPGTCRCR
jgi:RND superfamily putative drug exporter